MITSILMKMSSDGQLNFEDGEHLKQVAMKLMGNIHINRFCQN